MSTAVCAAVALLLSAAPLLRLALRDPKRLRSRRLPVPPDPRRYRHGLAAACLAPGVLLALIAQWPAFLIWLGGLCTGGWLLVQGLARLRMPNAPGSSSAPTVSPRPTQQRPPRSQHSCTQARSAWRRSPPA